MTRIFIPAKVVASIPTSRKETIWCDKSSHYYLLIPVELEPINYIIVKEQDISKL